MSFWPRGCMPSMVRESVLYRTVVVVLSVQSTEQREQETTISMKFSASLLVAPHGKSASQPLGKHLFYVCTHCGTVLYIRPLLPPVTPLPHTATIATVVRLHSSMQNTPRNVKKPAQRKTHPTAAPVPQYRV